ncbi:hypothetical protein ACWD3Z_46775, partial [Streptomyces sp. NPDC002740]
MLHQEIVAKGYRGHHQRVKMAITPLRRGLPIDTPRERPPSSRHVARWNTTAPPPPPGGVGAGPAPTP